MKILSYTIIYIQADLHLTIKKEVESRIMRIQFKLRGYKIVQNIIGDIQPNLYFILFVELK